MDGLDDLSLILEIKPNVSEADKALRNLTKGVEEVDKASKGLSSGLGTQINSFLNDIGIRLPAALSKIVSLLNVFGSAKKPAAMGGGTASVGGMTDVFGGGGSQGFNSGIDLGKMMSGGGEYAGADLAAGGEAAAGGAGAALGPIGLAVGAAVMGLKMFTSAVVSAANKTVQLAAVNNPAVAERFQRSLLDAEGVIGNRLIPVVDTLTQGVRLAGDVLQTILPSEAEFRDAMNELTPAINELRDAFAEMAPMLKQGFRDALAIATQSLEIFATAARAQAFLMNPLGTKGALSSSMGMSAAQASTIGIEDISKRAIEAAYGQGAGGPQERTANTLDKILTLMERELGRHPAGEKSYGEKAESAVMGIPAQFMRWIAELGR